MHCRRTSEQHCSCRLRPDHKPDPELTDSPCATLSLDTPAPGRSGHWPSGCLRAPEQVPDLQNLPGHRQKESAHCLVEKGLLRTRKQTSDLITCNFQGPTSPRYRVPETARIQVPCLASTWTTEVLSSHCWVAHLLRDPGIPGYKCKWESLSEHFSSSGALDQLRQEVSASPSTIQGSLRLPLDGDPGAGRWASVRDLSTFNGRSGPSSS